MKESRLLRKALLHLLLAAVVIVMAIFAVDHYKGWDSKRENKYHIQVVAPGCTDSGYSLYTDRKTGETFVDDIVPAKGHDFGLWSDAETPNGIDGWTRNRCCYNCGLTEERLFYPDCQIARLALEGDLSGIGKIGEVDVTADFVSSDLSLQSFAVLKYQGHESLGFDKKNFTLKLFHDKDKTQKQKLSFSHWNPEHKYVLKANYIDPSQCRNLVCANVWADITAGRDGIPEKLKQASNFGAADGFPVALYINGQFHGLYSLNLHKDDDLYGMSDGQEHAIVISNNISSEEAFFRSEAVFSDTSPWEVEFCGTKDTRWVQEKLNALITFVMEADDDTFRAHLKDHLDVEAAIDYLLSLYALGLQYNGSNNLVLICYDLNEPWIPTLYGMGTGFGLLEKGQGVIPPEEFLPAPLSEGADSATGSLLWDRLLTSFYPEICDRYAVLRQEIFTPDALIGRVNAHMNQIPDSLYQADAVSFPWPVEMDHNTQITGYITQRIQLLDEIFLMKEGQQS